MNKTLQNHASDLSPAPIGRELRDAAAAETARIGEAAREGWQTLAREGSAAAEAVQARAIDAGRRSRRYVRDEPVKSVLMAAAAGAVLTGLLMSLRRGR